MHLDDSMQEALETTVLQVQPAIRQRDSEQVRGIEQASDVEAVLDLVPRAAGLADYAWLKRMNLMKNAQLWFSPILP